VWFLAGTNGGSAERTCVIPTGKAILFPVINSECDFISMPNIKTDTGLVACATATDTVSNMQTTVDGLNLQQLKKYRVTSQPFTVTFASNNVFGYKPGTTSMASDGFWVLLQPGRTALGTYLSYRRYQEDVPLRKVRMQYYQDLW